jgi:RNA:NAD 2'-phosphotransferase (TPT1/KptA family)
MDKRLITISQYLAKYLRHAPHESGLALQPGGWVPVDDLLAAARTPGFPSQARSEHSPQRFYSMSAQIRQEHRAAPRLYSLRWP